MAKPQLEYCLGAQQHELVTHARRLAEVELAAVSML
jgi:hypothetical protein